MHGDYTRQILAIMFIDIVGYSKKMSQDEPETLRLLDNYQDLVVPIIEKYDGAVIKFLGDGLFCQFNSAINSIDCGLAINQALDDYNNTSDSKFDIQVRIGIHMGDVIKKGDDLFGDGVNVAARIESKAQPGGICITGTIYSAISSHPRFEITPMGKVDLKNIDFQHELFSIKTGFETEIPPSGQTTTKVTAGGYTNVRKKWLFSLVLIIIVFGIAGIIIYPRFLSVTDKSNVSSGKKVVKTNLTTKEQTFVNEVMELKQTMQILSYLQEKQQAMEIIVGNQSDFKDDPEGKFVLIIREKEQMVYTIVVYQNQQFVDVFDSRIFMDISSILKGERKRPIWVALL